MTEEHATARCGVTSLKAAAALMALVIERRNTIPVLGTVLVEINGGKLTMSGTDLDMEIKTLVDAECSGAASFCISIRALSSLAASAAGAVTFDVQPDGKTVRITSEGLTLKLRPTSKPIDYPLMMNREAFDTLGQTPIQITQAGLRRLLRLSHICVSTEETRYYLSGTLLCSSPEGNLRAVATDGHRMARIDCDVPIRHKRTGDAFADGILPRKAGMILRHITAKEGNEPVGLIWSDRRLRAEVGDIVFTSKLIDGTFPDYTRVIPKEEDGKTAPIIALCCAKSCDASDLLKGRISPVFASRGSAPC